MSLLRGLSIVALITLFSVKTLHAADAANTYYSKKIDLVVNNVTLKNLPMNPLFYNNYLLVPSREVFVPLGAYVEYRDSEKKVYIMYNDKLLTLQVNNKIATIGEKEIEMAIPPKIVANKLMIPLRSVSENLGIDVKWDSKNSTAFVLEKLNNSDVEVLSAEIENNEPIISNDETDETNETNNSTEENQIIDIKIPNKKEKNQFIIEFEKPVEHLEKDFIQDNRLILDIYNSSYSTDSVFSNLENDAVKEIRIGKEEIDGKLRTRIVFELNKSIDYSSTISEDKKYVFVDFSGSETQEVVEKPTPANTSTSEVSFSNNRVVISKNGADIKLADVIEFDDYNKKKYSFVFPSNFKINYKSSKLNINNSKVDYLEFSTVNNLSAITIHEKQILAPILSEDEKSIYINFALPKERYKNIVIIDPGHGGTDPGAASNGIKEKDINFSIANKVNELFKNNPDIKIYLTRNEDIFITRPDRIAFANSLGDLFISVHANANPSSAPKGIETYFYNNETVNKLGLSSKKFAEICQKNIINATKGIDRKVKTEPFDVIKFTNIPAILMEVGFVSNVEESKLLSNDSYQQKIANSIKETIYDTFDIYTPKR